MDEVSRPQSQHGLEKPEASASSPARSSVLRSLTQPSRASEYSQTRPPRASSYHRLHAVTKFFVTQKAIVTSGCHGYISEEYIQAIY